MDWEYVALTWHTEDRIEDHLFMRNYHRLYEAGWEVSLDAPFGVASAGGACIMRRPKDEPRTLTPQEIRSMIMGAARAAEAFGKAMKESMYPG